MGCCEQRNTATAFLRSEQGGTLRSRRVEYPRQVRRPFLDRWRSTHRHRVRQPRSAAVEHDESRERRETPEEPLERGILPDSVEVPRAGVKEEVDRPVADDLVGDLSTRAGRELNRRRLHGSSVEDYAGAAAQIA